jgi:hypothetical protein
MKVPPKELSLEYEIALFMLAIVLVRHEVTLVNVGKQFCPLQLTNEVNSLPFGDEGNFNVDVLALSHGMAHFFKGIKNLVEKTLLYSIQNGVPMLGAYHGLEPIVLGLKIKFNTISSTVLMNKKDLLHAIVVQRDDVLNKMNFKESKNLCL